MTLPEELRWTAANLINVGKLAIDSVVAESLKGSMQVYTVVKGKLKRKSPLDISNADGKQSSVLVEELHVKLEKMQQDAKGMEQQSEISTLRTERQDHLKQFFEEPVSYSAPEVTTRKKIFIRSRL